MNNERKRRVLLAWMLALILGSWASGATGADEQSLVVNPGFELGQGDVPDTWQKQGGDQEGVGQGRWHRERHQALADIAHYGEFYMRGEDAWQTLVQKVPVKGGQMYELSCSLKTDIVNDKEKGNTFLWLIYYDKDGKEIMPYDYGATEATKRGPPNIKEIDVLRYGGTRFVASEMVFQQPLKTLILDFPFLDSYFIIKVNNNFHQL